MPRWSKLKLIPKIDRQHQQMAPYWKRVKQEEHAVEVPWYPMTKIPPVGRFWATDGVNVWLLWSDGEPIPFSAGILRWTIALIPKPPNLSREGNLIKTKRHP